MIKDEYKKDLEAFEKFKRSRVYLSNSPQFKKIYELSYIIYNLLPYASSDSELCRYSNLIKRDLVSSIDLIDMQHFESAKRDLRSMIETVFRLIAYTLKGYIYTKRKEKKIYGSSSQIHNIRSALDTHKIWKLTSLIKDLFEKTIIYPNVKSLLDLYTSFSDTIHTNTQPKMLHNDLVSLTKHTNNEFKLFSEDILLLLSNTIVIIYFSRLIYFSRDLLIQQNFYYINRTLNTYISKDFLIKIQNNYLDGIYINFTKY